MARPPGIISSPVSSVLRWRRFCRYTGRISIEPNMPAKAPDIDQQAQSIGAPREWAEVEQRPVDPLEAQLDDDERCQESQPDDGE